MQQTVSVSRFLLFLMSGGNGSFWLTTYRTPCSVINLLSHPPVGSQHLSAVTTEEEMVAGEVPGYPQRALVQVLHPKMHLFINDCMCICSLHVHTLLCVIKVKL